MSLYFIRYVISLIFGILMTFAFGNIPIRKSLGKITGLFTFMLVIEVALTCYQGLDLAIKTYPLHTHLPLILFLWFFYKINIYNAVIYVMMAYMSCQIPAWFSRFSRYFFQDNIWLEIVIYLIFVVVTAHIILCWVGDSIQELLGHNWRMDAVFGIIPITYYLFDYVTAVWTELLYSGNYHVVQFMPFVLCIGYPIFIVTYRKEHRRRREAYEDKLVIEKSMDMIETELENIREIEKMQRIYRHDMRHHMMLLLTLIQEKKLDQAEDYIQEYIQSVTETKPDYYCDNDILNMLLTHYGRVAREKQIRYNFKLDIPDDLPISNMEICALVSNALDNACQGNLEVEQKDRYLDLVFKKHNNMLIFSVDNACREDLLVNGIASDSDIKEEHGFGSKSIEAIAKKYDGSVSFSAKNGVFKVMVAIQNA